MAKKDAARQRSKPERFESERTLSVDGIAGYLEGLAQGLREGSVALSGGDASFSAAISGDVELEVEARQGKKKSRVELTIAFRTQSPASSAAASPPGDAPEAEVATIPDEMSF